MISTLGVIAIDDNIENNKYHKMEGVWYDLEGTYTKCLEELEKRQERGKRPFKEGQNYYERVKPE